MRSHPRLWRYATYHASTAFSLALWGSRIALVPSELSPATRILRPRRYPSLADVPDKLPDLVAERPQDAIRGIDTTGLPAAPKRLRPRKEGSRREQRSIARVRASMALLLEKNADKYQEWFERAAAEHPLKALVLMKDIAEYFLPKLGRVEQVGEVTHKVQHFVAVTEREAPPAAITSQPEAIEGVFTSVDEVKR